VSGAGVIARALARALGWSALAAGVVAGCQPQDIYLFDPTPPVAARVDAGSMTPPAPLEPADEPDAAPSPPEQPPCASQACTDCVAQQLCAGSSRFSVCHPRTGRCALACEPGAGDAALQCPLGERCDPALELCVACLGDTDCSGSLAICDTRLNRCVECTSNENCPAIRPVCDASLSCVECVEDGDCAATGEVCLAELSRCVQCRDDADCRGRVGGDDDDAARCLPGELRCVECVDDGDCASDPEKPFCSSEFECEDERR
jgi:hypothetical protein